MAGSGCRNKLSICALRLTRCNANGSPVGGALAGAVAFVGGIGSLKWTADVLAGEKIREPDGCGNLAVTKRYPNKLAGMDIEIDMIVQSHELHEISHGAQLLSRGGVVVGHADLVQTACGAASTPAGVIVEAWGENHKCNRGDTTFPYAREVFARAYFDANDGTMQRGVNHLVLKGYAEVNPNFGDGPFNDLGEVSTITDWIHTSFDDTALPTAESACGYVATGSQS